MFTRREMGGKGEESGRKGKTGEGSADGDFEQGRRRSCEDQINNCEGRVVANQSAPYGIVMGAPKEY